MSDELTATDEASATGPLPITPMEEPEPTPELAESTVEDPAFGAPELETDVPTPVEAATSRDALAADAKNRSARTLFQGAVTAVFTSVVLVAATFLKNGDVSHLDWKALGMAVATAGGTALVAYLHRMLG